MARVNKFTAPIKVEVTNGSLDGLIEYKLIEGFQYYRTDNPKDILTVPVGFLTNGASIPRLFWSIVPPTGTKKNRVFQPAILHDYLYETGEVSRKDADKIFLEAMKAMKVNWFIRYIFYWCVRLFARSHYNKG